MSAPTTVDGVIARLRTIDAELPADDGVAVFNRMYLAVTERIAAVIADPPVDGKMFRDPVTMTELDVRFANLWLTAYDGIHAVMSLEAGLARSRPAPARQAFYPFAADTVRTLSLLRAALHSTPTSPADFPNLREDHNALLRSPDPRTARYALVDLESDRITNSLNTLTLEVLQWIAA